MVTGVTLRGIDEYPDVKQLAPPTIANTRCSMAATIRVASNRALNDPPPTSKMSVSRGSTQGGANAATSKSVAGDKSDRSSIHKSSFVDS